MERQMLEALLATHLADCQAVYQTWRIARQIGAAAQAWAQALAPVLDYPGASVVLAWAFEEHIREEERFPVPAQFHVKLVAARHKFTRDWWELARGEALPQGNDGEHLAALLSGALAGGKAAQVMEEAWRRQPWAAAEGVMATGTNRAGAQAE